MGMVFEYPCPDAIVYGLKFITASRVLGLVSEVILALLFAGEERGYHWWISGFVLVGLATEVIALGIALLGPIIPGPPP